MSIMPSRKKIQDKNIFKISLLKKWGDNQIIATDLQEVRQQLTEKVVQVNMWKGRVLKKP